MNIRTIKPNGNYIGRIAVQEKLLANTPIHYWINDNKSKEAIMFMHPAFANHTSFDLQYEHVKDNYKVIAMDLLGHGK